jgi:cellulose synthase/poly-beta-1,6-N-acetylglucosamine synthase-like glycosyltransferase
MMTASLRDLLWDCTILFGWPSVIALGIVWHANRRFKAALKAPLTLQVDEMPEWWDQRARWWRTMGLVSSWLSITCFISWLLSLG